LYDHGTREFPIRSAPNPPILANCGRDNVLAAKRAGYRLAPNGSVRNLRGRKFTRYRLSAFGDRPSENPDQTPGAMNSDASTNRS
jgi:hypothetical protein